MIVVPAQESGGEGSIQFAVARCSRTVNLIYIVILSISSFPRRRESSGLCPTHTHGHTYATVKRTEPGRISAIRRTLAAPGVFPAPGVVRMTG